MPALTRFCWEGDGSACPDALRTLFAVLATSCPEIHELHINSVETMGNTLRFNSFCQPLWHLTELTRVSISVTHRVGYHTHTWVPGLLDMLIENCPSLVDLHISVRCFHNAPIARLLLDAHWHLLRRLTLRGFMTLFEPYVNESEQTHVLERFLSRMPNLECLCIQNPMLQTFRGGLPHNIRSLRSLSLPFMCRVPRSVAQQLRCLGGIPFIFYTPSGPVWSLLAHMSALRVLFVEGMTDALAAQLFNIVPDLERLYCRLWHGSGPRGAFSPPDNLTPIFLTTLSRFTSLTHLSQLSLSDKETLEAVLKALTRAPRLRYVEMYIRPGACAQWITVERNTDGSYKGWEYTEDVRDLGFNDCAGLFRGII
ncbi:hypothetical protein K439DRAFT_1639278 [Ramaria rubella]|nr:hypothetical protein K439DRAFT_1639278 [Ramaria rubella]